MSDQFSIYARSAVTVPVAEIDGQFTVFAGNAGCPGRACETRVEVIETGTYLGRAVTKVLISWLCILVLLSSEGQILNIASMYTTRSSCYQLQVSKESL